METSQSAKRERVPPCTTCKCEWRYILSHCCVKCQAERVRKYRLLHGRRRAPKQPYEIQLAKRVAYNRQWRHANPDKAKIHCERWRIKNPASLMERTRRRQASQMQRIPQWADLAAMKRTYEAAKCLEVMTGRKYHVDHIVPLQGKIVCGLHVEYNLQILPAHINLQKANAWMA